ncbi:MAG: RnfABCDGE type electron transport complex subunit G [Eubacteriales bacterium]|nr:RnfABCDGE type electron transport complex subunit G [Eubacteriales bacterium]
MKKKFPPFAILTVIALCAALLLALTNAVTEGPIAEASAKAADEARRAVLPEAESFEELAHDDTVDSLFCGMQNGEAVGYTATVTVTGYGGPIEVTVGMDTAGTLTGLNVGGTKFAETAGLGARAKEPSFTNQFKGKHTPVTLNQDVDAISGATITSTAVTKGVNLAAAAITSAME